MIWYRRINSLFFTDTLLAQTTPLTRGNKYTKGFVMIYPMNSQSEFNDTLHFVFREIGVIFSLVMDDHMAQKKNKTKKVCHQVGTTLRILEEGTPWAKFTELYISLFKEAFRRYLRMIYVPMVLWDYCMNRWYWIQNSFQRPLSHNQERTPHESTIGEQGYISNICNFGWYQWVYCRTTKSLPEAK